MVITSDHSSTAVVVFEKQPYWGPELQRQFVGTNIIVRECRSLRDLLPMTRDVSSSVIVVDLGAAPTECVTWFSQALSLIAMPPVLIVASTEWADLEWPLRESGAVAFLHDEVSGAQLAQLCLRQLRVNSTCIKNPRFAV